VTPALERCVGDVPRFTRELWGRRPDVHAGADPGGFADLLTLDDVDAMVSSMALRLPAFRLIKDGATLPESAYTKAGRAGSKPMTGLADPARIFALFDGGATIVLQGMHRYWLPLARFCRDLELALGHPTQVNAYITPPGSQGLAVHEDSHDVFVLQAFGAKAWEVWDTRPPGSKQGPAEVAEAAPPAIATELRPGDALYMPRRTPHGAKTQETLSGHITVGIPATTWREVAQSVVDQALGGVEFDESLPAAYHRDPIGFADLLDAKLGELARHVEKADTEAAATAFVDRFFVRRPSLLRGALVDAVNARSITDASTLRRRLGSIMEIRPGSDRVTLLLGDRSLRMPARCEPALRLIDEAGTVRPMDLSQWLDAAGRLVLIRRLVREGLLEVVGGD
jgi:hypothetical protein